jgi:TATA-box binding protein (TBP) (component of TFIID and TFIIIB)
MSELIFPEFDDIPPSTKTFIAVTNLTIDINKLFNFIECTDYTIIPKKRGRKKKNIQSDPNVNIPSGSIITVEYEKNIKGVDLKNKNQAKKSLSSGKKDKFFRNSISIVMILENKRINFKISRNGKLQLTGCKNDLHAEMVVKYIWEYIKDNNEIYTFSNNNDFLQVIFIPAMRNITFYVGFLVNREELDSYINNETEYNSLLETSFGYTGVNIKIPLNYDINELDVKKLYYLNSKWNETTVKYNTYLDLLSDKEKSKKISKKRFNTFLVFHSGKIIMSGICLESMKNTYYEFINIIKNCKHIIIEKLD